MTAFLAIDFVLCGLGMATSLACFNALIGELYRNNQTEWQRLGCPACFAAQLKSDGRAKGIPTIGLEFAWMFHTPQWMTQNRKTMRRLTLMRIASVVTWVTGALWLLVLAREVI